MLSKDLIEIEIRKINDAQFEQFDGFPDSIEASAERWSEACRKYCETIAPPSLTLDQSKEAMRQELLKISVGSVNGSIQIALAFRKFAEVLGTGMNPTFTGIAPPSLIDFSTVYSIGFSGGSSSEVARLMANIIQLWFTSGTAINNSSGVTINWN